MCVLQSSYIYNFHIFNFIAENWFNINYHFHELELYFRISYSLEFCNHTIWRISSNFRFNIFSTLFIFPAGCESRENNWISFHVSIDEIKLTRKITICDTSKNLIHFNEKEHCANANDSCFWRLYHNSLIQFPSLFAPLRIRFISFAFYIKTITKQHIQKWMNASRIV